MGPSGPHHAWEAGERRQAAHARAFERAGLSPVAGMQITVAARSFAHEDRFRQVYFDTDIRPDGRLLHDLATTHTQLDGAQPRHLHPRHRVAALVDMRDDAAANHVRPQIFHSRHDRDVFGADEDMDLSAFLEIAWR